MYPYQSLAVIGPIVFLVLLIAFPLIGFFAGWKRAAYWGGGNFVFYCIGLIIWTTCGWAISNSLVNMIKGLIGQGAEIVDKLDFNVLVYSIVPLIFFILVVLAANIVLVICYYTFAKRLMGLKKNKKKAKEDPSQTKEVKTDKKESVANKKWFNRLVGSIGMGALMLPTTLTTTHLVLMTTTKSETRQNNSFANGLYNGLQGLSDSMSWFSYYNGKNNGLDLDGLFSCLSLVAETSEYKDADGKTQTNNIARALVDTVGKGFYNMVSAVANPNVTVETKEKFKPLLDAINNFTASWDSIAENCKDDIYVIFNSPGIITVLKNAIKLAAGSIKAENGVIQDHFAKDDSIYKLALNGYLKGEIRTLDGEVNNFRLLQCIIYTSKDAFEEVFDALFSIFDTSNITETNKNVLRTVTRQIITMFLNIRPEE